MAGPDRHALRGGPPKDAAGFKPTLAVRLAGKAPDDPAFVVPSDVGARLDRDRERAGVPKGDARGRTVDCHALRHTFGTSLAAGGVPVRVAMSLMRHSTSRLTESVYVDAALLPTAALESMIPGRPQASQPRGRPSPPW